MFTFIVVLMLSGIIWLYLYITYRDMCNRDKDARIKHFTKDYEKYVDEYVSGKYDFETFKYKVKEAKNKYNIK